MRYEYIDRWKVPQSCRYLLLFIKIRAAGLIFPGALETAKAHTLDFHSVQVQVYYVLAEGNRAVVVASNGKNRPAFIRPSSFGYKVFIEVTTTKQQARCSRSTMPMDVVDVRKDQGVHFSGR